MANNILDNLKGSKTVLIVGHVRPDGDCIGACLALREYCYLIGINDVDIAVPSQITEYFSFIPKINDFNDLHHGHYDTMVVLDCGNLDRINRLEVFFKTAKKTICIDHHEGDEGYGDYNLVKVNATSTCEILFDLIEEKNSITKSIANYLFIGLSSDTGHFMHNNTNSKTFIIASKLTEYGAEIFKITHYLNKVRSKAKTALISKALSNIRYYDDDTISIIPMTLDDFKECGVVPNESDGIIDYAIEVKGIVVGCSMSEESPNLFKISVRSNSVDVTKIVGVFGGGGHKYAAGCKINGDKETAIAKLLAAIRENC